MSLCMLCPRRCGVDRALSRGYCASGEEARIVRVMRHYFEEPCIAGIGGAGAIFFVGCNLGCVFCQNAAISHPPADRIPGEDVSPERLAEIMLSLERAGAESIDLVTPTHFTPRVAEALKLARREGLSLPTVWNSGGYESVDTLRLLDGLIDVYMPDLKYFSSETARVCSFVDDYFDRAAECISYMYRTLGEARIDERGIMRRGLLVRHLVLPGHRADSINVLRGLSELVEPARIKLSLMSQYSPEFYRGDNKALRRRVTSFEYDSVLAVAEELGFDGYMQARSSSGDKYTPRFEEKLVIEL